MNEPRVARLAVGVLAALIGSTYSFGALADDADAGAPEAPAAPPSAPVQPTPPSNQADVSAPHAPARAQTLEPTPAKPTAPGRVTFDVDPLADVGIVAGSLAFAGMLDLVNGTGEIRPQQISPTFKRSDLLGIDRIALSQHVDPHAGRNSTIGLFAAVAFAFIDPVLSAVREKDVQTGIVDGFSYAESVSLTYALTNITKMAVRRPRPFAYLDAEAHKGDPTYSNSNTDSSLSFFSGHSAIVAAVGATATYLAFARSSPKSLRPWITLVLATALSTAVSIERVRGGAHFPTDVIAATIVGAGVGVAVPHLHRSSTIKERRVWIGMSPSERGQGGTMQLGGLF